MKYKDYVSSQLVDQGTLLKKFNKMLDLIEELKAIKVYEITLNYDDGDFVAKFIVHSITEIKNYEDVKKSTYKLVNGTFNNNILISLENNETYISWAYFTTSGYETEGTTHSGLTSCNINYLGDL